MILFHLFLGFATSYFGFMAPSMLNMTASKLRIDNDRKTAYQFSCGVSIIVSIQVFLGIFFSSLIEMNPEIFTIIKKIAVIVFFMLSFIFLYRGIMNTKLNNQRSIKNAFVLGITLSTVNLFSIPFFGVSHTFFMMNGWTDDSIQSISIFGLGALMGIFAILGSYILLAEKFENRMKIFSKHVNLSIGVILGLVALYSSFNLYF